MLRSNQSDLCNALFLLFIYDGPIEFSVFLYILFE